MEQMANPNNQRGKEMVEIFKSMFLQIQALDLSDDYTDTDDDDDDDGCDKDDDNSINYDKDDDDD